MNSRHRFAGPLVAVALAAAAGTVQAQEPRAPVGELIAPVLSDATPVEGWRSSATRAYYTEATIEEVAAYYEGELGAWSQEDESSGQRILYWRLMDDEAVRTAGNHPLSEYGYMTAGVRLTAPIEEDPAGYPRHNEAGAFFETLRGQETAMPEVSSEEYRRVARELGHLAAAFYQLGEERDEDGRRLRSDEVILRECRNPPEQRTFEEKAQEVQALMAAGRMDEAMELTAELQEMGARAAGPDMHMAADPVGYWTDMVACLESLEPHAYRTRIEIHTHPAGWDRATAQGEGQGRVVRD